MSHPNFQTSFSSQSHNAYIISFHWSTKQIYTCRILHQAYLCLGLCYEQNTHNQTFLEVP
jgi:hypothetical protein